jgi:hypothetical protein
VAAELRRHAFPYQFKDHPEPERRRHLILLWLKRDVPRPIAPRFGRRLAKSRSGVREAEVPAEVAKFRITEAIVPRPDCVL